MTLSWWPCHKIVSVTFTFTFYIYMNKFILSSLTLHQLTYGTLQALYYNYQCCYFQNSPPLCLVGCSRVFLDVVYIRTRLCRPASSPRWSSTAGLGPGVCTRPSASSTCYSVSLPDRQKQQQWWDTRQDESNSTTNVFGRHRSNKYIQSSWKKYHLFLCMTWMFWVEEYSFKPKGNVGQVIIIHETLLKYCRLVIGMKWEISLKLEINQKWGLNSEELLLLH